MNDKDKHMRWKKKGTGRYECGHCGGVFDWKFPYCGFCGYEADNSEFDVELEEDEEDAV